MEHRLFSHISMNWRGRPLEDYETVVNLIGTTTNTKGLKVKVRLDRRRYRTGVSVSHEAMHELHLVRAAFHGDWNYVLKPRMDN
ncbi:Rhodopirellula transposase DDE domain-containing protein [Myxococcus virescens]|uniref:Rhodopirellula transposase DDE domain-containing protein n=1 Tax=Myxococcus virescens TaxID=83456 RepID=A0ABY0MGJ0_9BACT|nr:Rhodopirellula transposase DDE domain-containing protein [Myxococcus virescens]